MGSIVNISVVDKVLDSTSNYMLSIKDGSRAFIKITKDSIKLNKIIHPPDIQLYNPPSKIGMCEQYKVPCIK
jgi:hypothetical protein